MVKMKAAQRNLAATLAAAQCARSFTERRKANFAGH